MKPYSSVKAILGSSYTTYVTAFATLGQVRKVDPKYPKS